jgi:hypothetical protein
MTDKFDVVIEAVRYKNGQILTARAYERRGAVYSDRLLLDRKTLLEQIKKKKRVVTGRRKELWAGSFEIGKPVNVIAKDGKEVLSTRPDAQRDELEGVPFF